MMNAQAITAQQAQSMTQAALSTQLDEMLDRCLPTYWDGARGHLTAAFDAALAEGIRAGAYGVDIPLGVTAPLERAPAVLSRSLVCALLHARLTAMIQAIEIDRGFAVEFRVSRAEPAAIEVAMRVTWLPRSHGRSSDLF